MESNRDQSKAITRNQTQSIEHKTINNHHMRSKAIRAIKTTTTSTHDENTTKPSNAINTECITIETNPEQSQTISRNQTTPNKQPNNINNHQAQLKIIKRNKHQMQPPTIKHNQARSNMINMNITESKAIKTLPNTIKHNPHESSGIKRE